MTALLISLVNGGGLVLVGFFLGRAYERDRPTAQIVALRHPIHHHRRARHLRVVHPPFDFDREGA